MPPDEAVLNEAIDQVSKLCPHTGVNGVLAILSQQVVELRQEVEKLKCELSESKDEITALVKELEDGPADLECRLEQAYSECDEAT